MIPLTAWHRFVRRSIAWRLTRQGVDVEGSGVERSPGAPATVTRIWTAWAEPINAAAQRYQVPVPLILATIATETRGQPEAVRKEPGFLSDERTPHRISAGMTQPLLLTAEFVLDRPVTRAELLEPAVAIEAGAAYIARLASLTRLDPPYVGAAYNAGGLFYQDSPANRWKLRMYPIGTSEHVDRFVRWFNDAVAVLADAEVAPAVGLEGLLEAGV